MSFFKDIETLANPRTGVPALVKELPKVVASDEAVLSSNAAVIASNQATQVKVDKLQATLDKLNENPPDTVPPADPGPMQGTFTQE